MQQINSTPSETTRIQRSFQDIADGKITDYEQTYRFSDLGLHRSFRWDVLLKSRRVLIISEAGSGKTYECQTERDRLWDLGEPAFYIELSELVRNKLNDLFSFQEQGRFDAWLSSQSDIATFFLDSIDELTLSLGIFEVALKKLNKALAGQLGRVRIIITTRPVYIDINLVHKHLPVFNISEPVMVNGEAFADIMTPRRKQSISIKETTEEKTPEFRTVALMPFSDTQIRQMAEIQGVVNADELLDDIHKRNAEEFARRPQDLIELCADWRAHHRIRTHKEQVAYNIKIKLSPRTERPEKTQLSETKAFEGASRLALAALLVRKLTFRHSAEADRSGEPGTTLDPASILPDWSSDERSVLLERPLFGFASYGRVRFHHRSVVEYLAAQRLKYMRNNGMSMKALKRLLFAETLQGIKVIRPSMRPVAAWLALTQPAIFSEIRDREPNVLLDYGDPESLTTQQRVDALSNYVERYGQGNWRGLNTPNIQVHRFGAIELSDVTVQLWLAGIENPEVRELILGLIEVVPMPLGADIAYSVIMREETGYSERLGALDALVKLDDPRLEGITHSMETNPGIWPNDLVKSSIMRLFPKNIPADRLCRVISRISEPEDDFDPLRNYFWFNLTTKTDVTDDYLAIMRNDLNQLVVEGITCDKKRWSSLQTNQPHLIPPLSAACLALLKRNNFSHEVIESCTVALRLSENEHDYNRDNLTTQLKETIAGLPGDVREAMFWADDTLTQKYYLSENPESRFRNINFNGAISINTDQDKGWILASLKKEDDKRAVMLEAALYCSCYGDEEQQIDMLMLKECVVDDPVLVARIDDWLKPTPVDKETAGWEKKRRKRKAKQEKQESKAWASWILFWQEIVNNPQTAFTALDKEYTAWNLWKAMKMSDRSSQAEGWNRRFIEQYFNKEIADQLRLTMMSVWRDEYPTLRSERPNDKKGTYLPKWKLGLAAIVAEAEDENWAKKLSTEEATLAAKYIPIAPGGFPTWAENLIKIHSAAVEEVLASELILELDELATNRYHPWLLQAITSATPTVAAIFIPKLRVWLDKNLQRTQTGEAINCVTDRLRRVANILLKHGNGETDAYIRLSAIEQLEHNTHPVFIKLWLPILMALDPIEGSKQLEKRLSEFEPSSEGLPVSLIGLLFDNRHHHETTVDLKDPRFTPALLLRLLRLAYQHVRPTDDIEHDGIFTPGYRDYAESGRNALLDALLDTKGEEGWLAKMEMANDPLLTHLRDHAQFIALEKAAEEIDAKAWCLSDILDLNRFNEAPPTTHGEMFTLLVDRIDDIEDLLLSDHSPRQAWALISDEKIMRQSITRELTYSANNTYVVDQEAVTADEKETDIRLRTTTGLEAVIELKLGNKSRSGRELRDTIREQLVKKYMASDVCPSGCLLITVSKTRTWKHPDTDEKISIEELEAFLQKEATSIMKEKSGVGITARIIVRVLDLRPRLPTENRVDKAG